MESANDFFATAHEGTTPAQRAAEIRAQDKDAGIDSLATLLDVAQCDAGQAWVIARFLAGLYKGDDFPFDLTELRRLDEDLFEHCMAVLRLDHRPAAEIHNYFPGGAARWQMLINQWSIGARSTAQPEEVAGSGRQTYEVEYVAYSNAPGLPKTCFRCIVTRGTRRAKGPSTRAMRRRALSGFRRPGWSEDAGFSRKSRRVRRRQAPAIGVSASPRVAMTRRSNAVTSSSLPSHSRRTAARE